MGDLRVVFLSREYNRYLLKHCCVHAMKSSENMSRPYLLLPEKINGNIYCIPFSSPKNSDYFVRKDGSRGIKDDMVTRVRLIGSNSETGKCEVLGSLIINKMIPVLESEIHICDFNKRVCGRKVQERLKRQLQGAVEKFPQVIERAELLHKAMTDLTNSTPRHRKIRERLTSDAFDVLNFKAAEEACLKYKEHLENGLSRQEILDTVSHLPDIVFDERPSGGSSAPAMKLTEAQAEEQGAVGVGDSSKLQPQPQPKPQPKPLSLPPGSAWNKPLKFSSETKPPSEAKPAWDKPLTSGLSSYASVTSGMAGLSLTDGAVGGARPKCPESVAQGSVRAAIVDARGRGRGVNQSCGQITPKGRGFGRGNRPVR